MFIHLKNQLNVSGHDRIIATTTVSVPRGGPITATSVIESQGGSSEDEAVTPMNKRRSVIRDTAITPNAPPQCNYHKRHVPSPYMLANF